MHLNILVFTMVIVLGLGIAACGQKEDPINDQDAGFDGEASYTGLVKAILDANCIRCHAESKQGAARNGAPVAVNFDSYQAAKENAQAANPLVQSGVMPPSGTLSNQEKAIFKAWLDQGLKE